MTPFLPLLAEETLAIAPKEPFVPLRRLALAAAAALLMFGATTILLTRPAGQIPFWSQALWGFRQPFSVQLTAPAGPVARGRDLSVVARVTGFTPTAAELWVKDPGSWRWRRTPMLPDGPSVFRAEIERLPADVEYFVSVDGVRSPRSRAQSVDVPLVRSVETTHSDGPTRLTVETDRPMRNAELDCSCGKTLSLPETSDNRATLEVDRPSGGVYHVNVRHNTGLVRVSDDFELGMFESWKTKGGQDAVPDPARPFPPTSLQATRTRSANTIGSSIGRPRGNY